MEQFRAIEIRIEISANPCSNLPTPMNATDTSHYTDPELARQILALPWVELYLGTIGPISQEDFDELPYEYDQALQCIFRRVQGRGCYSHTCI
jgi:hypothetical protein